MNMGLSNQNVCSMQFIVAITKQTQEASVKPLAAIFIVNISW